MDFEVSSISMVQLNLPSSVSKNRRYCILKMMTNLQSAQGLIFRLSENLVISHNVNIQIISIINYAIENFPDFPNDYETCLDAANLFSSLTSACVFSQVTILGSGEQKVPSCRPLPTAHGSVSGHLFG